MTLTGISLLGWLHSFACAIAIATGAYVLCATKGTRRHRFWGWWYAVAMIVQSLLVMAIYNFDFKPGGKPGPHIFGFFHFGSLMTLAAVALALFSAPRQRYGIKWTLMHTQSLLFSYYMLISALINEGFGRVTLLRRFALANSPHSTTTLNTLAVRQAQLFWMLLWLAAMIYLAVRIAGQRKPPRRSVGYPARYTGGVIVLCVGAGILGGALLGVSAMPWGVLGGFASGIAMSRRVAPAVRSQWGAPTIQQGQVLAFAIALEIAAFNVMGTSGIFARLSRVAAWEASLAIVGIHFLLMRWSHGPWMAALGAAVLAWLGLGTLAHLPLAALAMGDGLLKVSFGALMAWPLLQPSAKVQSAP